MLIENFNISDKTIPNDALNWEFMAIATDARAVQIQSDSNRSTDLFQMFIMNVFILKSPSS